MLEFDVQGMTCQHCVNSVTHEVSEVTGVTGVNVNLDAGHLSVAGNGIDVDAVITAIAEAGYEAQPA